MKKIVEFFTEFAKNLPGWLISYGEIKNELSHLWNNFVKMFDATLESFDNFFANFAGFFENIFYTIGSLIFGEEEESKDKNAKQEKKSSVLEEIYDVGADFINGVFFRADTKEEAAPSAEPSSQKKAAPAAPKN